MTDPDTQVAAVGESVTLERVTDAVYDANDVLDRGASTIETVTIKAIFSQPSERDQIRSEARVGVAELRATVQSTVDVATQREGRRDRVIRTGTTYEVIDVRRDTHPFTDDVKQTLMLRQLDGR